MKKFWKWMNLGIPEEDQNQERILVLNGTIADESWFDDDITPKMFKDELGSGTGPVTVWINSPGGDCIAASQIYTMLLDYKGQVTVKIDGLAASAASVIAMAGNKILMSPTAMMMIHNPATAAFGDHVEMQKAIEMLDEVKESIINAYEAKTGLSHSVLSHMMDDTTWMNAKKAIDLGFADGLLENEKPIEEEAAGFMFSDKQVEMALMNKVNSKFKKEAKKEKGPTGRRVDDLIERLKLMN